MTQLRVGQPSDSRVQITKASPDGLVVAIRAGGPQARGLGVMALIWNAVIGCATAALLVASVDFGIVLVGIPFVTLFLMAGWYLAGAWLSLRFTRSDIMVNRQQLAVRHTLFGFKRIEVADCYDDSCARLLESFGQNGKPVYAVRLSGLDQSLTFGTALSREDKEWIVSEINTFLGVTTEPPLRSDTREGELSFEALKPCDLPEGSPVRTEQAGVEELLIETPAAPHHRLVTGLIVVLVLAMVLWISIATWRLSEFSGLLNSILGWALLVCAIVPALAIVVLLTGKTTVRINGREFTSRVGVGPIGYTVRRPVHMAERIEVKGTTDDPSRGSLATTVVQIGSSRMLAAWGVVPTCEAVAGLIRHQFNALDIETTDSASIRTDEIDA